MGVYGRSKAEGEAAVRGTLRKHLCPDRMALQPVWQQFRPDDPGRPRRKKSCASSTTKSAPPPARPTSPRPFCRSPAGALRGEIPWGDLPLLRPRHHVLVRIRPPHPPDAEGPVGNSPRLPRCAVTTRALPHRRPPAGILGAGLQPHVQAGFGIRLTPWQESVEQTIDRLLA